MPRFANLRFLATALLATAMLAPSHSANAGPPDQTIDLQITSVRVYTTKSGSQTVNTKQAAGIGETIRVVVSVKNYGWGTAGSCTANMIDFGNTSKPTIWQPSVPPVGGGGTATFEITAKAPINVKDGTMAKVVVTLNPKGVCFEETSLTNNTYTAEYLVMDKTGA